MNPRHTRRPRAAVLSATVVVTAALAVTVTGGCSPDKDDCGKRDKGAPTRTTSGSDTEFASFTKPSGGTSGGRGGTTSGGSKGGTTKGGVTAGKSNNDDCDDS